MLIRVSPVRATGREDDQYLGRLARAAAQGRVSDPKLVDAMLKRGVARHVQRRRSLDEYDGNYYAVVVVKQQ